MGEEAALHRAFAPWRSSGSLLVGLGLCLVLYCFTFLKFAELASQRQATREFDRGPGCRVGAVFGGAYGSTVQANLTGFRANLLSRMYPSFNPQVTNLSGFDRFDFFDPNVKCPRNRPITSYDRWRFCDLTKLLAPCVVYSIGPVQNEYGFEKAILAGTNCEVHTFDCTSDGHSVDPKRHTFHKLCLGKSGKDRKPLHKVVMELNHSTGIDAMKLDMEGLDAQALAQLQVDGPLPRQLAGELHLRPPPMDPTELPADAARSPAELGVIFMHLANLGYAIISRRNNLGGQAGCCAEFAWLHVERPCSSEDNNRAQAFVSENAWQVPKAAASNWTTTTEPETAIDPDVQPTPQRARRLVVSMSSFPGRAELAAPTVYSIMYGTRKPDALYLWVPVGIARFDHKDEEVNNVKEIPSEAKMLQDQFHGIVKVQSPKVDYGPATKLLPTLEVETDPDTIIITVDDDTFYSPTTVAELEAGMLERPGYAIVRSCEVTHWDDKRAPPAKGWRGWKLTEGVCKGFMTAYASAAYRREFLDDLVFNQTRAPKGCLHHDDVWFSAHLWIRNVPIWVLDSGGKSWPPMHHRPRNRMSISTHPDAEKKLQECIDYFHWMDDDARRKQELGDRKPYHPY